MLSAVVLPDRGAMNAVMVSSQDANRAGPRPQGRLRSPSSSPVSAAASDRGLAPASDGRSLMAVLAAGTGVSGVICGLPASAATGSPGLGMRAAMIRHAMAAGRDDRARQHGGDQRDQDGGRAGPRLAGTPAGQADDPPFAERGHGRAGQGCGDAGGEPGQPCQAGQAPADQQHHPDPGAVAGQERHPRACSPEVGESSPVAGPAMEARPARQAPLGRSGPLWLPGWGLPDGVWYTLPGVAGADAAVSLPGGPVTGARGPGVLLTACSGVPRRAGARFAMRPPALGQRAEGQGPCGKSCPAGRTDWRRFRLPGPLVPSARELPGSGGEQRGELIEGGFRRVRDCCCRRYQRESRWRRPRRPPAAASWPAFPGCPGRAASR